ncbi:MAG: GrpB family protein [Candidatus Thorarchaeota archaeon]|nr:GrpB family protein [Candidatus Thorarchaeota archaeon]
MSKKARNESAGVLCGSSLISLQCFGIPMHQTDEPVFVEEYNPNWVSWFQRLCVFLEPILGQSFIRIEHIGSTAIPDMVAKPIIDLDIVIREYDFESVKLNLEAAGYEHQGDLGITGREAFVLLDRNLEKQLSPHHLYVCDQNSDELHRHLAFRNYLRVHKTEAKAYSDIKLKLVKQHNRNRELYMRGKDQLIQAILQRALTWASEKE